MVKKSIAAGSIFLLILTGAWMLNENINKQDHQREEAFQDGVTIHSVPFGQQTKFRPREYIRKIPS